ncbi:MAG: aminotransferase class IV [Culicoidibacterales bacterium]
MFYHYNQARWQRIEQPKITEAAVFTTFRADTSNLRLHLERLHQQTNQQFQRETKLTLSQLQQAQQCGNCGATIIKVIVTKSERWFVATRKQVRRVEPLHLESVQSLPRGEVAKIKDFHRHEYVQQLEISRGNGFDDALYYLKDKSILETTIANIFWSDGNNLYTPTLNLPILAGTFQQQVINYCQEVGITLIFGEWTVSELKQQAKQIWQCNAVVGWQVVGALDDDWQAQPTQWTKTITKKIKQQEW